MEFANPTVEMTDGLSYWRLSATSGQHEDVVIVERRDTLPVRHRRHVGLSRFMVFSHLPI
jgi:hypothetical protein